MARSNNWEVAAREIIQLPLGKKTFRKVPNIVYEAIYSFY